MLVSIYHRKSKCCHKYTTLLWVSFHSPAKICMVLAPNIVHLSLLTSVGYYKKETNFKNCSRLNKEIFILYLRQVQNKKYFLDL